MSNFKAVIFDWGGVCCSAGEHFSNPLMLEQVAMTSEQMSDASKSIEKEFYTGRISESEFWNQIINKYHLKGISEEQLRQSYFDSYKIYPQMIDAINETRKNHRVALLSNLASDMAGRIKKLHNVDNMFEIKVFSYELGVMKPDSKIYLHILEKLQLKPNDCLFIDDSKANIEAAEKLGISTIYFRTPEQTIQELKRMKII